MKLIPVAKVTDLEPGSCLSVEAEGIGVALFNVNGAIYALDNTCPHAGGPLGEGTLSGEGTDGAQKEEHEAGAAAQPVRVTHR